MIYTKKIVSALFSVIFLASLSLGAPIVTSVDGDFAHGQTVVLSGTGFGIKSEVIPRVWDDMESGSFHPDWISVEDLSVTSTNVRHINSNFSGHLNFTSTENDGYFKAGSEVFQKWFVQYWFKLSSNWDWGTTTFGGNDRFLSNIKVFRLWNPGSTVENISLAYAGWEDQIRWDVENINPTQSGTIIPNARATITKDDWHLFQFEFSDNSGLTVTDGELRIWFDGQLLVNETTIETREDDAGLKRPFLIGFAEVWGPNGGAGETDDAPNDFFIDDVYMDNSWARVELGNNPIYGNCTHREVQIPGQWLDSSVSVTVNRGSFSDSEQVYWFVIDGQGVPSPGFLVDESSVSFVSPDKGVLITFGTNAAEVVVYDTAGNTDVTVTYKDVQDVEYEIWKTTEELDAILEGMTLEERQQVNVIVKEFSDSR